MQLSQFAVLGWRPAAATAAAVIVAAAAAPLVVCVVWLRSVSSSLLPSSADAGTGMSSSCCCCCVLLAPCSCCCVCCVSLLTHSVCAGCACSGFGCGGGTDGWRRNNFTCRTHKRKIAAPQTGADGALLIAVADRESVTAVVQQTIYSELCCSPGEMLVEMERMTTIWK